MDKPCSGTGERPPLGQGRWRDRPCSRTGWKGHLITPIPGETARDRTDALGPGFPRSRRARASQGRSLAEAGGGGRSCTSRAGPGWGRGLAETGGAPGPVTRRGEPSGRVRACAPRARFACGAALGGHPCKWAPRSSVPVPATCDRAPRPARGSRRGEDQAAREWGRAAREAGGGRGPVRRGWRDRPTGGRKAGRRGARGGGGPGGRTDGFPELQARGRRTKRLCCTRAAGSGRLAPPAICTAAPPGSSGAPPPLE